MIVVISYFRSFLVTLFEVLSCIFSLATETEARGSNTTMIVVVVIVVTSLLVALAVFLASKYRAKSPEIAPSNGEQKKGQQMKPGVKQKKKNKHSSSTTGVGEGLGAASMGQVQGGEKKKVRRKRSSSSPKVAVGSRIQLPKETMPGK